MKEKERLGKRMAWKYTKERVRECVWECQILADCQSKTFTNAPNEYKDPTRPHEKGHVGIYELACVDAEESSQHGTGRCTSQRGSKYIDRGR